MLQKRPSRRLFIVWMIYAVLAALLLSAASVAMTYIRPLPQIYVYLFSAVWVAVWLFVVCVFLPLRFRHIAYALHEDRLEGTDKAAARRAAFQRAVYHPALRSARAHRRHRLAHSVCHGRHGAH